MASHPFDLIGFDGMLTPEQARAICRRWNSSHDPGHLSDKAEWETVG